MKNFAIQLGFSLLFGGIAAGIILAVIAMGWPVIFIAIWGWFAGIGFSGGVLRKSNPNKSEKIEKQNLIKDAICGAVGAILLVGGVYLFPGI